MKPFAESADQNKLPIGEALSDLLAEARSVLEIGSGTGQHAVYFAASHPTLEWQPSDLDERIEGIEAWRRDSQLLNLLPAIVLDVARRPWPTSGFDVVYTANTLHIMPWSSVQAFFAGAGEVLNAGGFLCVYGPFHYGGRPTSPSNAQFDLYLQDKYPGGGVRNFEDLDQLAIDAGLRLHRDAEMPVNNRTLVWHKP